jgi:hypothetical protein
MKDDELNISDETYSGFKKLAGYQIIGGSLGLAIIVWGIYKNIVFDTAIIWLYLFMSVFFLYSFFCGVLCIQAKRNALKHSMINQCLQLAGFAMLGFAFDYVAGFYISLEFDFTEDFSFNLGLGISNIAFKFNSESPTVALHFNIVALLIIIWISKLMKKVNTEIEIQQTSEIGIDLTPQTTEN